MKSLCSNDRIKEHIGYFLSFGTTESMRAMFGGCQILELLDLSSFNTSNVTDMTGMFNSSSDLKNIYVSERWNMDSVTNFENMFGGSELLPNYNYDESYGNEKQYAHYNEGGYLTYKAFDQSELDPDHLYGGELWYSYETKPTTPIPNTTFKLYGTSDYGNDVLEIKTTDSYGKILFDNIELGTYTLEEITPNPEYILNTTKWTVIVDEQGNGAIVEPDEALRDRLYNVENTGNAYAIYNEPRYWHFTLRKVDKENETIWIEGAEFTLSGISDLGTEYNEVVESNENGRVIFNRIEKGTYILKETKAPTGITETGAQGGNRNYIADPKEYIVKIDYKGDVAIDGLKTNDYGDFVVKNDRAYDGKITVVKRWDDDLTDEERPTPVVHLLNEEQDWTHGITAIVSWVDDEEGDRPADVNLHLLKTNDGETFEEVASSNIIGWRKLNNGTWKYTFDVMHEDGYTYYVYEDDVYGYNAINDQDNMALVENATANLTNQCILITILKEWHHDTLISRPAEINVNLGYIENEQFIETEEIPSGCFVNSGNSIWKCRYPLNDEGKTYAVKEIVPEGYKLISGETDGGVPIEAETEYSLVSEKSANIHNYAIKPIGALYSVSLYKTRGERNSDNEQMGLTFGPSIAPNTYYSVPSGSHTPSGRTSKGNSHRCIHDDSWETIIYWNNRDSDVYEDCILNYCTKTIELSGDIYNPNYKLPKKLNYGEPNVLSYCFKDVSSIIESYNKYSL